MARDGNGTYDLPEAAFVPGTTIESTAVNSDLSDIGAALSESLAKDGQTVPTDNLPMGGFRHTGVGAAQARTHYLRADQYIDSSLTFAIDGGAADAYEITLSPGITVYAVGQSFFVKISNVNATTMPTFSVNSLTPGTIVFPDGTALRPGDLPDNACVELVCAALTTGTPTWHLMSVTGPAAYTDRTADFSGAGGRLIAPTRPAGDNGTDAATTAFLFGAMGGTVLRRYLSGLGTSNNVTTPNSKIDVAGGVCATMGSSPATMMAYGSGMLGGTLDCGTTGANGLDAGSLASSTTYHLFVIAKDDGTTALLASTSLASPTMPATYTRRRRIWSFRTDGSAHIVPYLQLGDTAYIVPVADYDSTSAQSPTLTTLASLPIGLVLQPLLSSYFLNNADGQVTVSVAPGANSALASTFTVLGIVQNTAGGNAGIGPPTNTSAQIYIGVALTSGSLGVGKIFTTGWIDRRGKDD